MKFSQIGYKEQTVKVREISMGTLIQTVAQAMIQKNIKDLEVRMVDCFMGAVESYNGLDELLMYDVNMDWKVSVYKIQIMHDNRTHKDYIKIIMSDNIEGID